MTHNNENLDQLLQQFVDQTQARQIANDIGNADRLFDAHPAPSVSPESLTAIQHNVQSQLDRNRRHRAKRHWAGIATIAAVLLVGLFVFQSDSPDAPYETSGRYLATSEWGLNGGLHIIDSLLAEIKNELGSLTEAIDTMDTGMYEPVNPLHIEMIELEELEAIADSTEFWKG